MPPPRDDDDGEKAEGEEEVCLYDPEQSEEMAVPVGYHRASKFVAGREVVYLREGTGEEEEEDEDGEEERNRAPTAPTATSPTDKGKEREGEPPVDESPAAPQDALARVEESKKQDDNAPLDRGTPQRLRSMLCRPSTDDSIGRTNAQDTRHSRPRRGGATSDKALAATCLEPRVVANADWRLHGR